MTCVTPTKTEYVQKKEYDFNGNVTTKLVPQQKEDTNKKPPPAVQQPKDDNL